MESDDQSNIPTKPFLVPGTGQPSPDLPDAAVAAMLGAGRSMGSGGAWQPPAPEELQRDFPLYEIRGILGRGGMGAVYQGWQRSLDRLVAIKILPPGMDDAIGGFTERFKREAKAMAQLQHPGIVTVFDAGTTSTGLLYFVMECITGTDVQQLVKERGRLDPAEALRITAAVCDALGYAHEHGIIPRDIKPSNIMLDARGAVKVADFGLAKSTAPETTMLTGSNVTMGTLEFMAPESLKGVAHVDHRVDLYAVGVMLYQMLTGEIPRGRFVPPSRAVPGLDKRLDGIVDKALQTEPAARYSSAIDLRTAIEPVLTKLGGTRRSARVSSGTDAPRSARGATRSTLLALAVLAITIGTFFALKKPGNTPVSPTPSPQVPAAAFPPGKWVQVNDLPEGAELVDGWIVPKQGKGVVKVSARNVAMRNTGIRARFRTQWARGLWGLLLVRSDGMNTYQLRLVDGIPALAFYTHEPKKWEAIGGPGPKVTGPEYMLELFAVGDRLIARVDGKPVPVATDGRLIRGDTACSTEVPFRDVEVINLDGLSEAEALKAAGLSAASPSPIPQVPGAASTFPPGKWTKVFTKAEDIQDYERKHGVVIHDGWIDCTASTTTLPLLAVPGGKGKNHGIRFHGKYAPATDKNPLNSCFIFLRREGEQSRYLLNLRDNGSILGFVRKLRSAPETVIGSSKVEPALTDGAEFDMQFIVIGDKLHARFNGKDLPVVTDAELTQGEFGIQTRLLIRDVEAINLDGLSEAEALKAAGLADVSPSPVAPPKWHDAFAEQPLKQVVAKLEPSPEGYVLPADSNWNFPAAPLQAGMIRWRGKISDRWPQLSVGQQPNFANFTIDRKNYRAAAARSENSTTVKLLGLGTAVSPASGAEPRASELALLRMGGRLKYYADGQMALDIADVFEGPVLFRLSAFKDNYTTKSIEYLPLDGLSEAEALKAAGLSDVSSSPGPQVPGAASTFPLGKWTKAITKFEDIPAGIRSQGHLTWHEGWIDGTVRKGGTGAVLVFLPVTQGKNQGIRLHGKMAAGVNGSVISGISVRRSAIATDVKAEYRLVLRKNMLTVPDVALGYYPETGTKSPDFNSIQPEPALKPGDEFDMELIAIGDKLYGKFNGKALPVVTDARLTEGEMGFQTRHLVRDIEVINLDGLSEAEALKAAGLEGK